MGKRSDKRPNIQYRTMLIREDAATTDAGFTGHASIFGNVDSYGTAIKKGAFAKTLKERGDRIPVLWQHDAFSPIGKALELKEDNAGLYVNASIAVDTTLGKDAHALLKHGVPLGLSIGFETIKSRAYEEADETALDWSDAPAWVSSPEGREYVRVIEEVRLWEFSVVSFPANEQAAIDDVRSLATVDLLSTLSEELRTGRIPDGDDRIASLQALVAAYQQRAEAGAPAATTPLDHDHARHRRDRETRFALAKLATLGVLQ